MENNILERKKEKLNAYWDSYNNDEEPDFMHVLENISEIMEVKL